MDFYSKTIEESLKQTSSTLEGLETKEALNRLNKNGLNEIKAKKKISPLRRFLSQFNNIMIILLLIVGILSLIYAWFTKTDYTDAIVILFSVIVNALMGYIQEKKAEDSLENLKNYVTLQAAVKRDNTNIEIDSKNLVIGDIITLESGDKVPADCRIIETINAEVDESILTGESNSIKKDSQAIKGKKALHERKNMLYAGTTLTTGKIIALVVSTGNQTELGQIAKNLEKEKTNPTPLEIKVAKVSKFITYIAAFLVTIVIIFGVLSKSSLLTIVMLCISMIVASVPECLPIAITATLSVGASQMAKKKAVVKKLSAIETLGATEIICSDKTGTLTTNEMTVVRLFENNKLNLNARDKTKIKTSAMFIKIISLCNNASSSENKYFGDPVEIAFLKYLKKLNINTKLLEETNQRLGELPFDSTRKMMSTINKINNKPYLLTKGSNKSILEKCTHYEENGKIKKLNPVVRSNIRKQEKQMASDALKVLALAYKPLEKTINITTKDENNLIFTGLIGLIDPPRSDVKTAIKKCQTSKVTPLMITGDSLDTALSIAREIGIINDDSEGILGEKIRNLSDQELAKVLKNTKVFARVTPEDKVRIVTFLQKTGKVIAMTGDGVNDAPAIKLASVGVGMGKSGSDVTKGAADIILMDDSFSTIVTAIEEGRRIYDNVINNILYNLSSNFTEIIIILIGMFTFKNIISPIHVLYIDLVADTLPSICLAFEKSSKNIMKRKPVGLKNNIFTPYFTAFLTSSVIIEVAISLFIFYIFTARFGLEVGQTMALLSIILNEFVFAYNCRSQTELITKRGIFSNKILNIGTSFLIGVQLLVFLTPLGQIFDLVKISLNDFLVILLINIIGFILIELLKPILNKLFKEKE